MSFAAFVRAAPAKPCVSSGRIVQRKLAVGASHDPLEAEADRVADEVLARPSGSLVNNAPPRVQRASMRSAESDDATPASVDEALASPGSPLELGLQQDMGRRFGHDFSRVRVHSGLAAAQSAQNLNAHAYTAGNDIVFGAGEFAPSTHHGRRLIAHELTHVVQQSRASGATAIQRDSLKGAGLLEPQLDRGWEKAIMEVLNSGQDAEIQDIELQGVLLNADVDVYAALHARLSPEKAPAGDRLAIKFRRTFKGALRKRWLKRFEEVGRHSKPVEAPELDPDWEEGILRHLDSKEDDELVALELQGTLLNAGETVHAALYARLSSQKPRAGDKLAVKFNQRFKGRIRRELLAHFKAHGAGYEPPKPDPYAHLPPGDAPGRQTQGVQEMGRIEAPKGVHLRDRPGTPTEDAPILPFDTLVMIDRKTVEKKGQQSWFYVVALGKDDGGRNVTGTGFVESYHVARRPPEPSAHLYQVKRGEMLKDIAAKYYKHGFDWGNDARVYVQAIYHANKDRDVVFRQKLDLTVNREALETDSLKKAHVLWREARVVEGQALWVPSNDFVKRLKAAGVIHHASISKAIWDATVGAIQAFIDWAQYTAGFVIGLLEGVWNALKDLFTGIWDLIKALWSVVKALFGDWDDLKAFGKKLKTLWENRSEIMSAIATDFMKKWENPDDYDRGNFQGEFLGYVMMTAFIILVTFGAGAVITGAGRLGSFIKLIQVLDKAGDITFYASKLVKAAKVPLKVVAEARDALKGRKALPSAPQVPSAPHAEAPHVSGTGADAPHAEGPDVDAPHADAPHADTPHADAPHVEPPHVEAPRGGTAKVADKPKASQPFDMKTVGADAETPQMLSMDKFSDVKLEKGQSALYILRDADGTILKCGKTSAKGAKNRFSVYKRAGKKLDKELRLEVYPLKKPDKAAASAKKAEYYEKALREKLEGAGERLPWDNTRGRLGRPGFGTPGEGVRTPSVTKGEMAELLREHKGNVQAVGTALNVHGRTADIWAKALGLWPKDFK